MNSARRPDVHVAVAMLDRAPRAPTATRRTPPSRACDTPADRTARHHRTPAAAAHDRQCFAGHAERLPRMACAGRASHDAAVAQVGWSEGAARARSSAASARPAPRRPARAQGRRSRRHARFRRGRGISTVARLRLTSPSCSPDQRVRSPDVLRLRARQHPVLACRGASWMASGYGSYVLVSHHPVASQAVRGQHRQRLPEKSEDERQQILRIVPQPRALPGEALWGGNASAEALAACASRILSSSPGSRATARVVPLAAHFCTWEWLLLLTAGVVPLLPIDAAQAAEGEGHRRFPRRQPVALRRQSHPATRASCSR